MSERLDRHLTDLVQDERVQEVDLDETRTTLARLFRAITDQERDVLMHGTARVEENTARVRSESGAILHEKRRNG
jgi:hypothetical protein